jgi:hypothetical protein
MRKLLLSVVLTSTLVFAGCNGVENEVRQEQQVSQYVKIKVGDSVRKLKIQNDDVLMNVLEENFVVQEKDGFINGVDEMVADANKKEFIAIYVNDESALKGASDLKLKDGDNVELKIETW